MCNPRSTKRGREFGRAWRKRGSSFLLREHGLRGFHRTVVSEWSLANVLKFCQLPHIPEPPGPRSFALKFQSQHQPALVAHYTLTVPEQSATLASDPDGRYPLFVYMHTSGSADIVKGDLQGRMADFLAQEDPIAMLAEAARPPSYGLVSEASYGSYCLAPHCPSTYQSVREDAGKEHRKRRLFWFKACDRHAYESWDFSAAFRVREVEALVLELIAHVIETLPIDASRIYYVGTSGGGYGALRLAELAPQLPAAVVPMAGYYPAGTAIDDHDVSKLGERLQDVPLVWMLHCQRDTVCRLDSPHVEQLVGELSKRGKFVEWVEESVAKGKGGNFHSSACFIKKHADRFFTTVMTTRRPGLTADSAVLILRDNIKELMPPVPQVGWLPLPRPIGSGTWPAPATWLPLPPHTVPGAKLAPATSRSGLPVGLAPRAADPVARPRAQPLAGTSWLEMPAASWNASPVGLPPCGVDHPEARWNRALEPSRVGQPASRWHTVAGPLAADQGLQRAQSVPATSPASVDTAPAALADCTAMVPAHLPAQPSDEDADGLYVEV